MSGQELLTLDEHKNVVYALAFNNPYGDKIVTGSFDRTAKVTPRLTHRSGILSLEKDITLYAVTSLKLCAFSSLLREISSPQVPWTTTPNSGISKQDKK